MTCTRPLVVGNSGDGVAESTGAQGTRVEKPSELTGAIEQGLAVKGPFIIEVMTDPEVMAPLAWVEDGLVMDYSGAVVAK